MTSTKRLQTLAEMVRKRLKFYEEKIDEMVDLDIEIDYYGGMEDEAKWMLRQLEVAIKRTERDEERRTKEIV